MSAKLEPLTSGVEVSRGKLHMTLVDGRELSVPLGWFPCLKNASPSQRKQWELIGGGIGIHWPLLDEDISVENLLAPPRRGRK
ncbi:MAG TPA: DUF2442 domain-containing protein [Terriglobales bacterium]